MGRQPGWMVTQTGRGRRCGRRDGHRFAARSSGVLAQIADGMTSEDAGSRSACRGRWASRWFRERGGMPSISLEAPSGRYLSFDEREEIALLRAQGHGVREIARRIGRAPSTISRELRRNAATRSGEVELPGGGGAVEGRAGRSPPEERQARRQCAASRLRPGTAGRSGLLLLTARPSQVRARAVEGSEQAAASRPPLGRAWSPEQIANRLKVDFPDDESMRISHEAIYQALYVRAAARSSASWWPACAPAAHCACRGHARAARPGGHVTAEVMISERPAEAEDRAVPGPLGRRPDHRAAALGDRHRRGAHDQVHDAGSPAPRGGLRAQRAGQERASRWAATARCR